MAINHHYLQRSIPCSSSIEYVRAQAENVAKRLRSKTNEKADGLNLLLPGCRSYQDLPTSPPRLTILDHRSAPQAEIVKAYMDSSGILVPGSTTSVARSGAGSHVSAAEVPEGGYFITSSGKIATSCKGEGSSEGVNLGSLSIKTLEGSGQGRGREGPKRKRSALDNDLRSVGAVRGIRQKLRALEVAPKVKPSVLPSNLLASSSTPLENAAQDPELNQEPEPLCLHGEAQEKDESKNMLRNSSVAASAAPVLQHFSTESKEPTTEEVDDKLVLSSLWEEYAKVEVHSSLWEEYANVDI